MDVPLGPTEQARSLPGQPSVLTRPASRALPTNGTGTPVRAVPAPTSVYAVPKKRLLLADDQELFLDGLSRLVEVEFEVVGTTSSGEDLVRMARALAPDVVVTDDAMEDLPGIQPVSALRDAEVEAKVVVLSDSEDGGHAARALEGGAQGYVLKRAASAEILSALRETLDGNLWVSPVVAGKVILHQAAQLRALGESEDEVVASLSDRQRSIIALVVEGRIAKEIAAELVISRKTVEYHKYKVMKRLGLSNTAELIRFAVRNGLDEPHEA